MGKFPPLKRKPEITIRGTTFLLRPSYKVHMDLIIDTVAAYHRLAKEDVLSRRRFAKVCVPRQEAMWLGWALTHHSLPEMACSLRLKHHATVIHGIRKIGWMIGRDAEIERDILGLLPKFPDACTEDPVRLPA